MPCVSLLDPVQIGQEKESRNGKKVLTSCSEAANNENSDNIGKTPHLAKISINSNSLKVRILER